MRKHMTHGEQLKITKLLRAGVTDMAEIQAQVFVHSDCIKAVAKKYANQNKEKKKAAPKKKAAVDPLT